MLACPAAAAAPPPALKRPLARQVGMLLTRPRPPHPREQPQSSPLSGCGLCVAIAAGNASAVVQVADVCTSCNATDLTIDAATFAALGGSSAHGVLPVTYRPTECRPPAGTNLTVSVSTGRLCAGIHRAVLLCCATNACLLRRQPITLTTISGAGLPRL